MQRQFTSGSRQAPDPFDQFLEQNNFYRKHTARDASCLFRVISEQMYDTQLHHLAIRKKCVRYMRKNRNFFAPLIDGDLDEYLDDMSKPKTFGTLIELQAAGYMFQRNVLLFEPFTLGNCYINGPDFSKVFRVFYTPERHFDSVYTSEYIKDAAISQAICYEILYKDLYKLPDVSYAVEQMLNAQTLESAAYATEKNQEGYCTRINFADGRYFSFDLPQNTNCILENYKLCHFHYDKFPKFSEELHREIKKHTNDNYDKINLCKTAESLLHNKYMSCVRQLLQEGITPFPYKVAKALDPNMYRNIEFDAWNEQRKELKLQHWYFGDTNFKVGAKCHVKLCKSQNDVYTCHIQDIAVDKGYCIVYIEELGEKRMVPYESLTPLAADEFKPWMLPYRFQRQMQKYGSVRFTRQCNYRFKFNDHFASTHEYFSPICGNMKGGDYAAMGFVEKDEKQHYAAAATVAHHRNGYYYKLKKYTHFENFRAQTVEYCTMPLTVEHAARDLEPKSSIGSTQTTSNQCSQAPQLSSASVGISDAHMKVVTANGSRNGVTEEEANNFECLEQPGSAGPAMILPDFHCVYPMQQNSALPEDYYTYGYEESMHPPPTALIPQGYYMCPPPGAPPPPYASTQNNLYMQTGPPLPPPQPVVTAAPHTFPNNGIYYPNPALMGPSISNALGPNNAGVQYSSPSVVRNRNVHLNGRINWDAKKSVDSSGLDLPTDIATLRYFYNLGLEHHYKRIKQTTEDAASTCGKEANITSGKACNTQARNVKIDESKKENKQDTNNNSVICYSNVGPVAQSSAQNGPNMTGGSTQNQQGGNKSSNYNRRFPSRYFNSNKERVNSRNRNINNSSSTGAQNASKYEQKNVRNANNQNTATHALPIASRNKMGGGSNNSSSGGNNFLGAEQGTSSSLAGFENSGTNVPEKMQNLSVSYNSHQNAYVPYDGSYGNDYGVYVNAPPVSMGHTMPSANGNIYLQMGSHTPYGIYAAAPPLPPLPPHPSIGPAVAGGSYPPPHPPQFYGSLPPAPVPLAPNMPMQGPPTSTLPVTGIPGGFYPAQPSDPAENIRSDGVQFQCIPYASGPPPMSFYYSPPASAMVGGFATNGGSTMSQLTQSAGGGGGTGSLSGNCPEVGTSTESQNYCGPPNALLPLPFPRPQSSLGNTTTNGTAGGCVNNTKNVENIAHDKQRQ